MKNIIFICFFILMLFSGCSTSEKIVSKDYYNQLRNECPNEELECCLSSVNYMENNNYSLAKEDMFGDLVCDEGFSKDMMKCVSSYSWCSQDQKERITWEDEVENLIKTGCIQIQIDVDGNICSLNEEKTEFQYCTEMITTQKFDLPKCVSYE